MAEELIPAGPIGRANNFDLVRMALALCVIVSHSFPLYYGAGTHEPGFRYTGGMLDLGKASVIGFFFISGVLISASWERSRSAAAFFESRARRIYPAFLAATGLIGLLLLGLMANRGFAILDGLSLANLLAGAALLCTWMPKSDVFAANPYPTMVNGSAWSIPYEFACYLLCAAILALFDLRRARPAACLLAVTVGLMAWSGVTWDMPLGVPGVRCISSFGFGMLAYAHRGRIRVPWRWVGIAALSVPFVTRIAPALAVPVLVALIGTVLMRVAFSSRLQLGGFAKHGDFSYGTYLWGFFVQQTLAHQFGTRLPFWAFVASSIVLSVSAGVVSWFAVERWCLARRAVTVALPIAAPREEPVEVEVPFRRAA